MSRLATVESTHPLFVLRPRAPPYPILFYLITTKKSPLRAQRMAEEEASHQGRPPRNYLRGNGRRGGVAIYTRKNGRGGLSYVETQVAGGYLADVLGDRKGRERGQ